jgi:uncharacterized protein (TIGR03437 family)
MHMAFIDRLFVRKLSAALLGLLTAGVLSAAEDKVVAPVDPERTVALRGHVHSMAQRQWDQGLADPALELRYATLMLKPDPSLPSFLQEQQDPLSPNFHRWLTPEQFADRFGASAGDIAKIVAWLQSQGLKVNDVARGRHWITFSGTRGQAARAFRTEFHRYLAGGQTHIANATEPSIPAAFQDVVAGIRGLTDFRMKPASRIKRIVPLAPDFNSGPGVHYLVPDDIATIYDIAPLYNSSIDGTGQKIVVVGQTDIDLNDIRAFRKRYKLPARDPQVVLVGPDPGISDGDLGEADLDIEWSGSIARNATIVYVNSTDVNISAQYAVDHNLAPVISMSYGLCEQQNDPSFRAVAQQANAQGITWFSSSGDAAAADCDPAFAASQASQGLAADFPASVPEITAVGGTEFNEGAGTYWASSNSPTGASALSYIPEKAWNDTALLNILAGTGGGKSVLYEKPAWQAGPGVPNDHVRDIPDIAFSASADHDGYFIFTGGGLAIAGGTSIATPIAAGVAVLLNQSVVSRGVQDNPGLGNINPELYRLAQTTTDVFHDIKTGDNIVPCAQSTPNCSNGTIGFKAGTGYDATTGLGSLDVNNLIAEWGSGTTASSMTLTATPASVNLNQGTVQLMASVSATGGITPSGTVDFVANDIALGSATVTQSGGMASASLAIDSTQLNAGDNSVKALYSGNKLLSGSSASASVAVTLLHSQSAVVPEVFPNPVLKTPPDSNGLTYEFFITLQEQAGVATTLTRAAIDGNDITFLFNSTAIPAMGSISVGIGGRQPGNHVFLFSGMDADGTAWTHQITVPFLTASQVFPSITLSSTPADVQQNPAADAACQWSQQLTLEENSGYSVQLTSLTADGRPVSTSIQKIFGTTTLAPFGRLQGTLCFSGLRPPTTKNFEIDGAANVLGQPVNTTLSANFSAPAAAPAQFSASPASVTIPVSGPSKSGSSAVALSFAGGSPSWTVSILPANGTTSWLTVSPVSGIGSGNLSIHASSAGLAKGVYSAVVVIQAADAVPQFINVPVAFVVGASAAINIHGVSNAASFKTAFAPGMLMTVFGTNLASGTQLASILPLPLTMKGTSATVNGVTAPLFSVTSGQITVQIPYETGAGTAVLGINHNGAVASFLFPVAISAPGIFGTFATPPALVPFGSGQPGEVLLAFITGEGDVTPPLGTGQTPASGTAISDLPTPSLPVSVTVGGIKADVAFAGIPPGLAGVTQINFTVPKNAKPGPQDVVVTIGGVSSPPVTLNVTMPAGTGN